MLKNIMDNFLVPYHEIIPKEQVEQILKEYGIKLDNLPAVLSDDAVVQELNAKKGDLIKVVRKSHTAGETISFRVVI